MSIHALGVARTYGDHTIFNQVNLDVREGARLALIGPNGSGKSTLLRLLAGVETPDAGSVSRQGRVAFLAQQADLVAETVLDAVTPPELLQARNTFDWASQQLSVGTPEALNAFSEAEETYRHAGGYDFGVRAESVLSGLDLRPGAHTQELSGGQMRRVMLARLLLAPADVYLLDEPTNHLDQDGAQWLEGWILASEAAFVLASHDRAFLDAVATQTAELERGKLTLYPGNYSAAMEIKATLRVAQERDYAAYKRKRAALDEEMRRQASIGSVKENRKRAKDGDKFRSTFKSERGQQIHANRAKAMQKQIERLDEQATSKPYMDRRMVRLDLPPMPLGAAEVLTVKDLSVRRGTKEILGGVNLQVRRGDVVALTGPNGGGKSTLLRALLSQLPHGGQVKWGADLRLYVAGQHGEELAELNTVGDALLDANPDLTPHQLYEVAAQVQLPAPAFSLRDLSGGQRTRLSLVRLSVTRSQVLILDEPTNHLDIRMIEALEELLLDYSGTVLFASHDRRLVERVATRIWEVGNAKVTEA